MCKYFRVFVVQGAERIDDPSFVYFTTFYCTLSCKPRRFKQHYSICYVDISSTTAYELHILNAKIKIGLFLAMGYDPMINCSITDYFEKEKKNGFIVYANAKCIKNRM